MIDRSFTTLLAMILVLGLASCVGRGGMALDEVDRPLCCDMVKSACEAVEDVTRCKTGQGEPRGAAERDQLSE
jgi:hypothetical protein